MGEGRTEEPRGGPETNHRLTVGQAAERLGITKGAVRSRIKRGTLPTVKDAGRVYVVWGGGTSPTYHDSDNDEPIGEPSAQSELIESLQDQVAFLRAELERRGEEADRYQRIVAGLAQTNANLTERMRELEPPSEPRDEPETARQDAGGVEDRGERAEAQADVQEPEETARRPWWVRWFGG
jgi:excisionase family DNA binding protein